MGNRSSSASKQKSGRTSKEPTTKDVAQVSQNADETATLTERETEQISQLTHKLYRSISHSDQPRNPEAKVDFRLRRRSFIVGGHVTASDALSRRLSTTASENVISNGTSRTLPRNVGRSRSSVADTGNSGVVTRHESGTPTKSKRRPISDYSGTNARNINATRPVNCLGINDGDIQFPNYIQIQRRTDAFQRRFVENFLNIYSSLPISIQTSALSVAVRRNSNLPLDHSNLSQVVVISLSNYLEAGSSCVDLPLQLPASEYALTITPDCFELVQRARVNGCGHPAALARSIVSDVAAEAAVELARVFEYQLVLLGDEEGLTARMVAQRAAERAVDYLKRTSRHVDTNSLARGVIEGRPKDLSATVSAIVGPEQELQWNVDELFERPGLRRERLLVAAGIDAIGGYGTPWTFYAKSEGSDATLYGYRSQLLTRDFHSEWLRGGRQRLYKIDLDEEAAYNIEVPWRPDDFHRTYRPYRRLIGSGVMAGFAALSDEDKLDCTLSKYVQHLQGEAFHRDEIEPVYRPLHSGFYRIGCAQSPSCTVTENSSGKNEPVILRKSTWNGRTSTDECQVRSTSSEPRRPPALKPKPDPELIRRMSAVSPAATMGDGVNVVTPSTAVQRQRTSSPGHVPADRREMTSPADVRFPTLSELFGSELAAIKRTSTNIPNPAIDDNNHTKMSTSFNEQIASTATLSSPAVNGITASADIAPSQPTRLLESDI